MRNALHPWLRLGLRALAGALVATALLGRANASMTVLIGEPFGRFGTMMPVGHAAIYLDHLCADGPLKLRACRADEAPGVVIARYHRIGNIDWVATPVMEFLYAVENASQIPAWVTADDVWQLRQRYRRRYLASIVPDGQEKDKATDEWWETAGVAYNRRVWGYRLTTTAEQDARFMATLNATPNHHLYHLKKTNCANFAADMVNLYFPDAVKGGDHIADFGLMTPKQVARSVATYGQAHTELGLEVLDIAQVPGELRRSRPVRGSVEAGLKTKRYLVTLAILQPEIPVGLAVLYAIHGCWQVGAGAVLFNPASLPHSSAAPAEARSGQGADRSRMGNAPNQASEENR